MKSPFFKYFLILALVVVTFCSIFWREISESAGDAVADISGQTVNSDKRVDPLWPITGFKLELERNNIKRVSAGDLQVLGRDGNEVSVSFLLTNQGGSNDFPALRLHLLNAQKKAVRWIELTPDDYEHSSSFSSERIKLNLSLRAGESSFTVEPFYKTAEKK